MKNKFPNIIRIVALITLVAFVLTQSAPAYALRLMEANESPNTVKAIAAAMGGKSAAANAAAEAAAAPGAVPAGGANVVSDIPSVVEQPRDTRGGAVSAKMTGEVSANAAAGADTKNAIVTKEAISFNEALSRIKGIEPGQIFILEHRPTIEELKKLADAGFGFEVAIGRPKGRFRRSWIMIRGASTAHIDIPADIQPYYHLHYLGTARKVEDTPLPTATDIIEQFLSGDNKNPHFIISPQGLTSYRYIPDRESKWLRWYFRYLSAGPADKFSAKIDLLQHMLDRTGIKGYRVDVMSYNTSGKLVLEHSFLQEEWFKAGVEFNFKAWQELSVAAGAIGTAASAASEIWFKPNLKDAYTTGDDGLTGINRYPAQLKFLNDKLNEILKDLPAGETLNIVDFGAGDGREPATFAAFLLWWQDTRSEYFKFRIYAIEKERLRVSAMYNIFHDGDKFLKKMEPQETVDLVNSYLPDIVEAKAVVALKGQEGDAKSMMGAKKPKIVILNNILYHLDTPGLKVIAGALQDIQEGGMVFTTLRDLSALMIDGLDIIGAQQYGEYSKMHSPYFDIIELEGDSRVLVRNAAIRTSANAAAEGILVITDNIAAAKEEISQAMGSGLAGRINYHLIVENSISEIQAAKAAASSAGIVLMFMTNFDIKLAVLANLSGMSIIDISDKAQMEAFVRALGESL